MFIRNTKIICTIGPATYGVERLTKLIESGMDVARLNFSHGSYDQHLATIQDIRTASGNLGKNVGIIQDLQGPKIRTEKVTGGSVLLKDNAKFIITTDEIEYGTAERVSTSYKNLIKEIQPGNTILLDDGYLILLVEDVVGHDIITKVVKGGILKDKKGIIAPSTTSTAPSMSEKDVEDLQFGLQNGIDLVALSFVRSDKDILELKTLMKLFKRTVPVISKIERPEAYYNIDAIIKESDGIMVARGDLGLEMPAEQVPVIQKEIIKKCNYYGKPVITATQMLESMINNPRPTRAEASDVANAVVDGSDAVMLSGETSIGSYPFDTVSYMDKIIKNIEEKYIYPNLTNDMKREPNVYVSDAFGRASCVIADQVGAKAIVAKTDSGYTARNISKYRPYHPIIALSTSIDVIRQLSYLWGIRAIKIDQPENSENLPVYYTDLISQFDFINKGDYVIFVAGHSPDKYIADNLLKVLKI